MDEHPIVRMSIEVLLQKNKDINVVLKTDDGREVIDYMRANPVDLVILDIELPNTDGFTLLKRIKGIQENTKILFLSSKSESFYAGRAIQAGANGFVSKPNQKRRIRIGQPGIRVVRRSNVVGPELQRDIPVSINLHRFTGIIQQQSGFILIEELNGYVLSRTGSV
ncbi:Fimbriae Z protein [Beauveria bassiana D1-5]|uniref:Stress response regulator protein 1 n=1 Tax=Beauveria bassiana D1-5 TaxID=1245745 RepID=A0A0A2W486_BEABA|nr:Fimbriae Z protein [Beauveria bassiana D1-5]